jgi:hypothetical protein
MHLSTCSGEQPIDALEICGNMILIQFTTIAFYVNYFLILFFAVSHESRSWRNPIRGHHDWAMLSTTNVNAVSSL